MVHDRATDEMFMRRALREAERAPLHGDVPIGAVAVRDGQIIAAACNTRELYGDPTGHAEISCIRAAALALGGWRLVGVTLYVTLEPCPMCAGAIIQARINRCVFGAPDHKVGAAGSVTNLIEDPRFLHRVSVSGGILADRSLALLDDFFRERRAP